MKSYPLCKKAGFTIVELSMDFSKRAVWADDVESYLSRETEAIVMLREINQMYKDTVTKKDCADNLFEMLPRIRKIIERG